LCCEALRGEVTLIVWFAEVSELIHEELVSLCHHQSNAPRPDEAAEAEATAQQHLTWRALRKEKTIRIPNYHSLQWLKSSAHKQRKLR
jgi:hypothetical protein